MFVSIRRPRRGLALTLATLVLSIAASQTARADAIDGDWCMGADHMNINGSNILTPGRNKITGTYNRYSVNYSIPATEPGAGGEVRMIMVRGTETIHVVRPGTDPNKPEVWTRCKPIS